MISRENDAPHLTGPHPYDMPRTIATNVSWTCQRRLRTWGVVWMGWDKRICKLKYFFLNHKNHVFSLIFIDFHWFPLIFIDFLLFLMIYREVDAPHLTCPQPHHASPIIANRSRSERGEAQALRGCPRHLKTSSSHERTTLWKSWNFTDFAQKNT